MATQQPAERRIVVGVDGSPSSKQALRWAVGQAELTGAVVDAVICWLHPVVYGRAPASVDQKLGRTAEKVLAQTVAETVGGRSPAQIRESAHLGNAAEVLLEQCRGADLLVLGSRGHGGLAGALLGSVSQHCAQHATCPVVVVRADTDIPTSES